VHAVVKDYEIDSSILCSRKWLWLVWLRGTIYVSFLILDISMNVVIVSEQALIWCNIVISWSCHVCLGMMFLSFACNLFNSNVVLALNIHFISIKDSLFFIFFSHIMAFHETAMLFTIKLVHFHIYNQ
jgi:hypothetical protein